MKTILDLGEYTNSFCVIALAIGLSFKLIACTEKQQIPDIVDETENITVYSTDDRDIKELQLVKDLEVVEDEELIFGNLSQVAVDQQGRIYISDHAPTIHVFESDGSYLRTIGQAGSGPAEFQRLSEIEVYEDYLFAYDSGLMRMSVFDLNQFELERTFSVAALEREDIPDARMSYFMVIDEHRLLGVFGSGYSPGTGHIERKDVAALMDSEGDILNNRVLEFPEEEMIVNDTGDHISVVQRPYGNRSTLVFIDDILCYGWTEDLLLKKYNPDGEYLSGFYHNPPRIPLEMEDALAMYEGREEARQTVRDAGIPDYRPAFHSLFADEEAGRLWIGLYNEDPDSHDWWVMDGEGRLKGRTSLPKPIWWTAMAVRNDKVYLVTETTDNRLKLVRYMVHLDD